MTQPRRLALRVDSSRARPRGARRAVNVKRACERPMPADGIRVLVERRWPAGLSKERVSADLWLKDAAPSDALARGCGKDPARWDEFKAKYRAELATRADVLRLVDELRQRGPVTLLHAGGDKTHSSAAALREILDDRVATPRRKPTGD